MKKKLSRKSIAVVVSITIIVVSVLAVMYYGYSAKQAERQADSFIPEGVCGMAITKARHNLTGITHEFNSTCIPDGWSAV